jgi:hypothetical protein
MGICEVREALAKFNPNPVKVKFIANNTEWIRTSVIIQCY